MKTSAHSGPVRHVVVVFALALTAAACGGNPDAAAAAVDISDDRYQPADTEVATGASVTWTNQDDVPHTVTFTDDEVASSDTLQEGDQFSATFDAPGTYAYACAVHPEMQATVTVTG